MLKRILTLSGLGALVLIFILASLASASSPPLVPSAAGESYAPDRILVRFEPGVDRATIADLHRKHGAVLIREIPQIGVQVLRVPTNRVPEMVAAYSRNPNVLYAEPDYVAHAVGDPNDPHFGNQWALDNEGQEYKEGLSGTEDADIDASEAWDITTGDPTVYIAILDTGIDQDHEDLGKIVADANFTRSKMVDDKYGHGTHVAGIVAADTNNTVGVAGLGYNSSLLNVKVLGDNGSGRYSWIAEGIVWAADYPAQVINMSLGGYSSSKTLEEAVNYAWGQGVVLAAAAGNDGTSDKLYPAAYANCMAVAATDAHDQRVDEPGWWASNYGDWVDVAAPGLYIYSTTPNHRSRLWGKADETLPYDYGSGTSMATPHVAGLAGLLLGQDLSRTNADVRTLIEDTADPIPGTGTYWIHGRINACNAVGGACEYIPGPPPNTAPTADAGADQTVNDDDGDGSESVTLDGSGSSDPDGTILSYEWKEGSTVLGTDPIITVSFDVAGSPHTVTLTVTDDDGASASDDVLITVLANQAPTADAGPDQIVQDSDDNGSEDVTLDGSGSSDPDGSIVSYEWFEGLDSIATGVNPTVTLAVGDHTITLTVTDNGGAQASDEVLITVLAAEVNQPPVADAGADQTVNDDDGDDSESVTLDGSGSSDPDGSIVSYEWFEGLDSIATGVNPTVTLAVGDHTITLVVTDDDGASASDDVLITVLANQAPTADAGPDQIVQDSDDNGSEDVTLDGSGSSDPDGSIVSYEWFEGLDSIATGVNPTVTLAVGDHTITLVVTDNGGATDTDDVLISITAVPALPKLTVVVTTDKPTYTFREWVYITVTVTDPDGNPVDAAVHVDLTTASGRRYVGDANTGSDGVVVFRFQPTKKDGSGTYYVTATASKEGYQSGSGSTTFDVY